MQSIKFIRPGHSSSPMVGSFSPGDIARLPDDLARHLVVEAAAAEYLEQPQAAQAPEPIKDPAPAQRRARRVKE
jgi:hypothetical protein